MANRRHIPERKCVACGHKFAKRELIRIVRTPEGAVMVDQSGKSAGRGAYMCRSSDCWQRGVQSKRLERSLDVTLSPKVQSQLLAHYQGAIAGQSSVER
ncbi:MAG: hypothetical protein BZY88_09760 [SAR202 cluster bacterium Io17-Chloro-G9]|nr:MAG: hypothetical protein BZY88_09760 [SAR202 cluster bacterium Io17-Chloro-G9]